MVWVEGVPIVVLVSRMMVMSRTRRVSMKVRCQEAQEELKGRKEGLLLPRCRRGQEFGDTEGRGASRREEGEADWIPSPETFFCKFIVISIIYGQHVPVCASRGLIYDIFYSNILRLSCSGQSSYACKYQPDKTSCHNPHTFWF